MNDVSVIDRFLDVFSRYIDSGFGLLQGEVAFLTATLIVIDMTLAGLLWAMSHATGQGEDVIAKLIRKVLYVGAFAYIIGNFNMLAGVLFRSFAGLGLAASGSTLSMGNFLQPGRLAKVGIDAGAPILDQIRELAGFPEVFIHIAPIVVLFLAWIVVIVSFFVLAVQLFITLIEFKLTTLAGFVLVPFALWNKTAFLAEKVLGMWCLRASRCWYSPSSWASARDCSSSSIYRPEPSPPSTRRWSSCWPRCPCWPWASAGRASRRGWYPVDRSSARARWPVLPSARPEPLSQSVPRLLALVVPWPPGYAWPRQPREQQPAVRGRWLRTPAAPGPHTKPVPLRPVAASRALPLAWAMLPRPGRRRLGRRRPMVRAR